MRNRINRWIYRRMRNDMVARMRLRGWTWTKINTMLQGFGMTKVITHYEYTKGGIKLYFGEPRRKGKGLKQARD